ncbi:uncharacterized protein TRIADDRAFT_53501 [Trichoplax adhaerens]|uniref:Uncharacterized protein n=1 Tax=Trichoplax adhaerens TaxID=10228 RepID=B3RPE0_TRIAD|nr:predicted protein [Trichoplax adhaerens]EDV28173.1 predicted protein [Trichoplax adhaerens]|eukprot:XP_002110007.1 predicted protein [Trichoplax adhaerens]
MHGPCHAFGENCQELVNNLLDSEERENNLVRDYVTNNHATFSRHQKTNDLHGWIPQYHEVNKPRSSHKSAFSAPSSQHSKKSSSTSANNLPFHRLNSKPSIDYKFQHFQQSERYIEQYRENHTIGLNRLEIKQDDENTLRKQDDDCDSQKQAKERRTYEHQLALYKQRNGNSSPHQQHDVIINESFDETAHDHEQPDKRGATFWKKFRQPLSTNASNDSMQHARSQGNPKYNVKSIPSAAAVSTGYFRPLSKRNQLRNSSNHFKSITKTALQAKNKYPPNGLQAAIPTSINGTTNATPRQLMDSYKHSKPAAPVQMITKVNNRNRINKITLIYRDIPSAMIS